MIFFLQLAGLAFFTSLAVSGFMITAGLGDVADARSAHRQTIPTGGGIGLVAGLGAAAIALNFMTLPDIFDSQSLHRGFAPVLSLIFAVSMLGIVDDILNLSARIKFGILLILCGAVIYLIGPVVSLPFGLQSVELPFAIGFFGSVLWIFVVVNAVNFIDGANGFMGVSLAIASFGLFGVSLILGAPGAAVLSLVNFAILLGFLPYNLRTEAKVFAGDVGALCVGFIFALAAIMLVSEAGNSNALYAAPILILPLLTDVFLTLIRRVRRKENLLRAHNQHLYQRLIRAGMSHVKVTWAYGFVGLILANLVLLCTHIGLIGSVSLLPFFTGMLIFGYYMISGLLPD
ncbi:MAG: hypothetical protein ABJG88_01475 [Litorimonas sp.]